MTVRELGQYVTGDVQLYKYSDEPGDFVDLNKVCKIDDLPGNLLKMEVAFIYAKKRNVLDIRVVDSSKNGVEKRELSSSGEVPE